MIQESKTIYKCPYCNKEYDDFSDAQRCAEECADVDSPIEDEEVIFICEYCKKKFKEDQEADECEIKHKEERDSFYCKIELEKASKHPNQVKLFAKDEKVVKK